MTYADYVDALNDPAGRWGPTARSAAQPSIGSTGVDARRHRAPDTRSAGLWRRPCFVARDELVDVFDLTRSQTVEFVAAEAPRGPRALAVRPCERAVTR